MADEHDTKDAEKKSKRAAYMRKYRAKNPEKFRETDKLKEQRAREKDLAGFLERAKMRAQMTPEQLEKLRVESRARNAKWRAKDPEYQRKRASDGAKRRYAKDPTKVLAQVHRRRSFIKTGNVTKDEWESIKAKFGGKCAYCRQPFAKLEMDHVVPMTRGGLHVPENVVPACKPCNIRKGNRRVEMPVP